MRKSLWKDTQGTVSQRGLLHDETDEENIVQEPP